MAEGKFEELEIEEYVLSLDKNELAKLTTDLKLKEKDIEG